MHDDIKKMALDLGYEFIFAALLVIDKGDKEDQEGSAILSKYPVLDVKKYRYDDGLSKKIPIHTEDGFVSKNGGRSKDRFLYHNTLLTISIQCEKNKIVTVSTTHFPVVDHSTPGLSDHHLDTIKDIEEIEHSRIFLDRLISIIRSLTPPTIFTADLNNTRGEYMYDTVAHELVDIVPHSISSTIDPKLHRIHNLKLVVDTIMVSQEISVENFEIIENVSDHKALLASLAI